MAVSVNPVVAGTAGSSSGSSGAPSYSGTWAGKPAASSLPAGSSILITSAIATGGQSVSSWYSDGTNYKPFAPVLAARKSATTTGAIQTADQVIGQLGALPAGLLSGATFFVKYTLGRTTNADAFGNVSFRIGTAGTTADTSLGSVSAAGLLAAAGGNFSTAYETWCRMTSATAVSKIGRASTGFSWGDNAAATGVVGASTAISNVDSSALFISITTTMGAATTTAPTTGYLELVIWPSS